MAFSNEVTRQTASRKNTDKGDLYYDFAFLTDSEANHSDDNTFWFRAGSILDIKNQAAVNKYLIQHKLMQRPEPQAEFANEALFKLWSIVHDSRIINFYLEKDESLDKVLNIFIRVNSGGNILTYSDLLLSIATAQWEKRDAREEITALVDELNLIGDGFRFNKDFVLKSSLVLTDFTDIAFKVDNFNKNNMLKIEEQWELIEEALRGAVTFISSLGYSSDTLTANYAVIPIAYYLKIIGMPKNFYLVNQFAEDRNAIREWLIQSLVKRAFGGTPDAVLRPIREIIRNNSNGFPLNKIIDEFKGTNKSLIYTHDDVENLLEYRYKQSYTFSILALLYRTFDFRNKFHIDHIHPRSRFTRAKLLKRGINEQKVDYYLNHVDLLPNLQFLEGILNQEKSDTEFAEWIEKTYPSDEIRAEYKRRHFIPETDKSIENFQQFFEDRMTIFRDELCKILGV